MAEPSNKRSKMYNKKKYYAKSGKNFLGLGQKGFLVTCNFHERDCVKESYNILNEYADLLYASQKDAPAPAAAVTAAVGDENDDNNKVNTSGDITDELNKELQAAKMSSNKSELKRFQVVQTGALNFVFIRTTLPDPVELGAYIVDDLIKTGDRKTRFVLRMVPIEVVCKANLVDIKDSASELFDKYFVKDPCSYSVVFNRRYNNDIYRDDVILMMADIVYEKNPANKVDLRNPQKSVLVEIMKGFCLMSVIEGYLQKKKYNLAEMGRPIEIDSDEPEFIDETLPIEVNKAENETEVAAAAADAVVDDDCMIVEENPCDGDKEAGGPE